MQSSIVFSREDVTQAEFEEKIKALCYLVV